MHTWISTQTEGWWRQAFDLIDPVRLHQHAGRRRRRRTCNAKYDVIIFRPAGGRPAVDHRRACRCGATRCRGRIPPETPNIGTYAQTDDIRPGLGYEGLMNLQTSSPTAACSSAPTNTADFAMQFGLTNGVSVNSRPRLHVVGALLRTKLVDDASPIVLRYHDNLAVYSDDGSQLQRVSTRGGGRGGRFAAATRRARPAAARRTIRMSSQGRAPLDPKFDAPTRAVQPWQARRDRRANAQSAERHSARSAPARGAALRRPARAARVRSARWRRRIAQRPVVVDAPMEKGHVVLFANNPISAARRSAATRSCSTR